MDTDDSRPLDRQETLSLLQESRSHERAFMDLRYRFFGSFMIITGLFLAAAFEVEGLQTKRSEVATAAVVITILFWRLDRRTWLYHRAHSRRIRVFEKGLQVPDTVSVVPKGRFSSNTVTNTLFALSLAFWLWAIVSLDSWIEQGNETSVPAVKTDQTIRPP